MFKLFSGGVFLVVLVELILFIFSMDSFVFGGWFPSFGNYIIVDSLSVYLVILVVLLGVYSMLCFANGFSVNTILFLMLSLIFSLICFCVNHSIVFWCVYEMSMIPLLYLIFKESPYSERFLAAWYFSCYLIVTSLPLVLILIYLSVVNNSFFFSCWSNNSEVSVLIYLVLSLVFFTKVPLFPFHTWLPIVHAEATSIVSIFLSGYIMKLGLLGVYRCTFFIFNCGFFVYLFMCLLVSVFFLIVSSGELDGKRWLAFLSLSHIVVPFLGLFVGDWSGISFSFLYCLGHGLGAGIVFGMLWYFYDLSNSRNWILLKSSISGSVVMILVVVCLLSLCSFPPTIQFFCEINLISISYGVSMYILFWVLYLFFGGLVPLVLCGHLLIRSEWVECYSYSSFNYMNFLFVLCLWCYIGLIVL